MRFYLYFKLFAQIEYRSNLSWGRSNLLQAWYDTISCCKYHLNDLLFLTAQVETLTKCSFSFLLYMSAKNRTHPVVVHAVLNNFRDALPVNVAAVAIFKRLMTVSALVWVVSAFWCIVVSVHLFIDIKHKPCRKWWCRDYNELWENGKSERYLK